MDIRISSGPRYPTQWQFNTSLLSDDTFHKIFTNAIDDFIVFNQSGSEPISKALLWESLKAYLRGQMITFLAQIKKLRISTIQNLSSDLESVDKQLALT